jgi:hypothetical protein
VGPPNISHPICQPLSLNAIGSSWQHFLDLDRNPIAAHDDCALRDRKIVGENLHLVILGGVELNDGAATKPQDLVNWHCGDAEHYGNVKWDFVDGRHFGSIPP